MNQQQRTRKPERKITKTHLPNAVTLNAMHTQETKEAETHDQVIKRID